MSALWFLSSFCHNIISFTLLSLLHVLICLCMPISDRLKTITALNLRFTFHFLWLVPMKLPDDDDFPYSQFPPDDMSV